MTPQEGVDALVAIAPPRGELEAGHVRVRQEVKGADAETTAPLAVITLVPCQYEKPSGKVSCAETRWAGSPPESIKVIEYARTRPPQQLRPSLTTRLFNIPYGLRGLCQTRLCELFATGDALSGCRSRATSAALRNTIRGSCSSYL